MIVLRVMFTNMKERIWKVTRNFDEVVRCEKIVENYFRFNDSLEYPLNLYFWLSGQQLNGFCFVTTTGQKLDDLVCTGNLFFVEHHCVFKIHSIRALVRVESCKWMLRFNLSIVLFEWVLKVVEKCPKCIQIRIFNLKTL